MTSIARSWLLGVFRHRASAQTRETARQPGPKIFDGEPAGSAAAETLERTWSDKPGLIGFLSANDHKTIEQRLPRLEHAAITQPVPVSDEELASIFADAIEDAHTRNPARPDGQHIIAGIRAVRVAIEAAKETINE